MFIFYSQFVAETSGPDLMYILYFLNCQVVVTITMVLILAPKFYAVHMKLEVRRRDSLPTISGMMTQHIKRPCRSVGVQTTPTGEDNDIISNNATWLPFRKRSKVRPIEAPSSNKYETTMTIDSIKSTWGQTATRTNQYLYHHHFRPVGDDSKTNESK